MAYNYLLDLYRVLDERHTEILQGEEVSDPEENKEHFRQGRLAANRSFLSFIKEKYHVKLPRRLQKQ